MRFSPKHYDMRRVIGLNIEPPPSLFEMIGILFVLPFAMIFEQIMYVRLKLRKKVANE